MGSVKKEKILRTVLIISFIFVPAVAFYFLSDFIDPLSADRLNLEDTFLIEAIGMRNVTSGDKETLEIGSTPEGHCLVVLGWNKTFSPKDRYKLSIDFRINRMPQTPLKIYVLTNQNWEENNITWDNAPFNATDLWSTIPGVDNGTSVVVDGSMESLEIELDKWRGSGDFTFVLCFSSNETGWITLNSWEFPYLVRKSSLRVPHLVRIRHSEGFWAAIWAGLSFSILIGWKYFKKETEEQKRKANRDSIIIILVFLAIVMLVFELEIFGGSIGSILNQDKHWIMRLSYMLLPLLAIIAITLPISIITLRLKDRFFSKDAWVIYDAEKMNRSFDLKKFVSRGFWVFFLNIALSYAISDLDLINPASIMKEFYLLKNYQLNIPIYLTEYYLFMFFMTLPFSFSLWAIVWYIEDAGIFVMKKVKTKFGAINISEIHLVISRLLKSLVGIATIVLYINLILWSVELIRFDTIILVFLLTPCVMILIFPFYWLFMKLPRPFLQGNLMDINTAYEKMYPPSTR
ncbi:MAG: hypothetical protein ACFFCS_14620 [Candidatus Hodarchaeota archaeon]